MARDSNDSARLREASPASGVTSLITREPWLEHGSDTYPKPGARSAAEKQRDPQPVVEEAPSAELPDEITQVATIPGDRRSLLTRIVSGVMLGVVLTLVYKLVLAGYYIASDSFVAPIILSPDSDSVLPSKLNLARLSAERASLAARIDQANAALRASEQGALKLQQLKKTLSEALGYTENVTTELVQSSHRDLQALSEQRRLIQQRVRDQEEHVAELGKQLESGLVRRSDLLRERDLLNQLKLAALQNDRERLASSVQLHSSSLAQRALTGRSGERALSTPEMVQQQEQLIRLEVDLLKLEAEAVTRRSELRTASEELAKLDGLIQQVRARPVFRAIESRQNVAFVPYTQLEGTVPGAPVYWCSLWGMLSCQRVGRVTRLLPGEVAAQDPWGAPSRGQYALLALDDPSAATAKVLRVRGSRAEPPPQDRPRRAPPLPSRPDLAAQPARAGAAGL